MSDTQVASNPPELRQMNVRVPDVTLKAGRVLAAKQGLSLSEWVGQLMAEKILASKDQVAQSLEAAAKEAAEAVKDFEGDVAELKQMYELTASTS